MEDMQGFGWVHYTWFPVCGYRALSGHWAVQTQGLQVGALPVACFGWNSTESVMQEGTVPCTHV